MEIFKYLQYKDWIEPHTSKPLFLYIHWIKQACCSVAYNNELVLFNFQHSKSVIMKSNTSFLLQGRSHQNMCFLFFLCKMVNKAVTKLNWKRLHICISVPEQLSHILYVLLRGPTDSSHKSNGISEQQASLPGGVSVSALLFWPVHFADWYAARSLRALVWIWISKNSPDGSSTHNVLFIGRCYIRDF